MAVSAKLPWDVVGHLRRVVVAVAVAVFIGSLVYADVSRDASDRPVARAASQAAVPPPGPHDAVRYRAEYQRHREAVAAAAQRRRAEAAQRRRDRLEVRRIGAEQARLRAAIIHQRLAAEARAEDRAAEEAAASQPRDSGGLIVGDSVSLGAQRCLAPLGYRLDSEVGRQFSVGLQRLQVQAAAGLPETVVVHLGTNGPFGADGFTTVMDLLGSAERVVWVTIALPDRSQYAFRDSLNAMIRDMAGDYGNVRVADFAAAAADHPEWFYDDGVHINSAGCAGFANVVNEAVTAPVG
jgi:hypothetical protein